MMARIPAILLIASTLGACTTLGACGGQESRKVSVSGGGERVTMDRARQLALEPFAGPSRWYAVMAYTQGREVVMVSDPSAPGGSERRLVRLTPGGGYVVSRIHVLCRSGAFTVRDARLSKTDAGLPTEVAQVTTGLDIRSDIAAICGRTAKLPTFEGRTNVAVAKARRLGDAMAGEGQAATKEAGIKTDPRAPQAKVIRMPDKRPEGR